MLPYVANVCYDERLAAPSLTELSDYLDMHVALFRSIS